MLSYPVLKAKYLVTNAYGDQSRRAYKLENEDKGNHIYFSKNLQYVRPSQSLESRRRDILGALPSSAHFALLPR